MQAPPQAHVSDHAETRQAHPVGKRPRGVGVSTPCMLLLGLGRFLGGHRMGVRPVLFSGMRSAELLLFWSQMSILMVPGWCLTPEPALQTRAGTPSLPPLPSPGLSASFVGPRQWVSALRWAPAPGWSL